MSLIYARDIGNKFVRAMEGIGLEPYHRDVQAQDAMSMPWRGPAVNITTAQEPAALHAASNAGVLIAHDCWKGGYVIRPRVPCGEPVGEWAKKESV